MDFWDAYPHLMEAFELAMKAEGIPEEKRKVILETIEDICVNDFGDD